MRPNNIYIVMIKEITNKYGNSYHNHDHDYVWRQPSSLYEDEAEAP